MKEDNVIKEFMDQLESDFSLRLKVMHYMLVLYAEESARMNCAEIALETNHKIGGLPYRSRISINTFEASKKSLDEMAADVAGRLMYREETDLRELLTEAVKAGYSLHAEDFD